MQLKAPKTVAETCARIHAGVLTATFGPGPGPSPVRVCWPREVADGDVPDYDVRLELVAEGRSWRRAQGVPKFVPTPAELDDCLTALGWLNPCAALDLGRIDAVERELLRIRAWQLWRYEAYGPPRPSYRRLADWMVERGESRRDPTTWRKRHDGLIVRAHTVARLQHSGHGRKNPFPDSAFSGRFGASIVQRVRAA